MGNLLYLLEGTSGADTANVNAINDAAGFCSELGPVLRIVGIVVFGIKVVVPIILIVIGMMDMARAVTEKSEEKIKKAQSDLIKKAIAAVIVFLIVTIVGLLMRLVNDNSYQNCMECINHPFQCDTGAGGVNAGQEG